MNACSRAFEQEYPVPDLSDCLSCRFGEIKIFIMFDLILLITHVISTTILGLSPD